MSTQVKIYLMCSLVLVISENSFGDVSDYAKAGCQSAVGWNIIQKISNDSYLVEFETSGAESSCVRKSNVPGGCIAAAVLRTKRSFSSIGEIQGHLHIKKGGKSSFKQTDGFAKTYQIYEESDECSALMKKVDNSRAKKDPVYDCHMTSNPESCYQAGKAALENTISMTGPWHNAMDLLQKACSKKLKKACELIKRSRESAPE